MNATGGGEYGSRAALLAILGDFDARSDFAAGRFAGFTTAPVGQFVLRCVLEACRQRAVMEVAPVQAAWRQSSEVNRGLAGPGLRFCPPLSPRFRAAVEILHVREMHSTLPGRCAGDARAASERRPGRDPRFRACCGPVFPVADPLGHIQMLLRMCQFHRSVSGPICAEFGKADNPA